MVNEVLAFILAGGQAETLNILGKKRTKAAIPFGGIYRLIDFALSSLANSSVNRVGILTQYRPSSLIEHIYFGKPWDLKGRTREVRVLPPFKGEDSLAWYKGTADAVYQNINFVTDYNPDYVFIISGDYVHNLDFSKVFEFHLEKKADVTIVTKYIEDKELHRFGIVEIDKNNRIKHFNEKPEKPDSNLISLTMYLFNKRVLLKEIEKDSKKHNSNHNFAKDILPNILKQYKVFAYVYEGPWYYIGNIEEYWKANMLTLSSKPIINPEQWGVRTNLEDRKLGDKPPAHIQKNSCVLNSIIARGCIINGNVKNSVLFPGVVIEEGAQVIDSIIMHDAYIAKGVYIEKAILDKDVYVNEDVKIGFGKGRDITVIGKATIIPKSKII